MCVKQDGEASFHRAASRKPQSKIILTKFIYNFRADKIETIKVGDYRILGIGEPFLRLRTGTPDDTDASKESAADPMVPAMLAALPGSVMCLDADGKITGTNKAGERLAGTLSQTLIATLRKHAVQVQETGETLTHTFSVSEDGAARSIDASMLSASHGAIVIVGRDSTLDVNIRSALIESRRRYRDLVEISSDFAWETTIDGAFSFVSPQGALGYPAETLVGMAARDLLFDPETASHASVFEAARPVERRELWLKNAAAEPVCVLASALPLFDGAGQRNGARGVCRDITPERLAENDLARHKAREQVVAFVVDAIRNEAKPANMLTTAVTSLGRAMTATSCAVYQTGDPGKLTRAARYGTLPDGRRLAAALKRAQARTGIVADQMPGYEVLTVSTHYRGHANGAMALCRESGAAAWNEEDRLLLSAVAGQLGIALQQIADQQELVRLSRTDPLTGLLNRRAFMDELARAMERTARSGETSAVLYMDLDNFKTVNDLYGHAEGDNVLKRIAQILRSSTRRYDSVARLGGDEFAIWMENIDRESIRRRIGAIIENSQDLFDKKSSAKTPLGLSVGVALHQLGPPETPAQILRRADAAMYRSKDSDTENVVFASNPLRDESRP